MTINKMILAATKRSEIEVLGHSLDQFGLEMEIGSKASSFNVVT